MTPFELTLNKIKVELNKNIDNHLSKISVSGYNRPGNTQVMLTLFDNNNNYHLDFLDIKNIRFFKIDGNEEEELVHLQKYINMFIPIINKHISTLS